MKVFFREEFYTVYTSDPAAEAGRMEAIIERIRPHVTFCSFSAATDVDLAAVHPPNHIEQIRREGLYEIAALAAGGAISAAESSMSRPSFALIRPPGHHASAETCWGFCFFNNMAVSLKKLHSTGQIRTAFILDFDLHFGDGNVNILEREEWVDILNPQSHHRQAYLNEVQRALELTSANVVAVSAGFDNHVMDWGGLLATEDYYTMGRWVNAAARRNQGGCYGILEGGYNHEVLGENVLAFLQGLNGE